MSQTVQTPDQQRFLLKLLGYDYTIEYKPGRTNTVADALSRHPAHHSTESSGAQSLTLITSPISSLLQKLREECMSKPDVWELIQQLTTNPNAKPPYQVRDGVLFYHGRLVVSRSSELRWELITQYHSSPVAGHGGFRKTWSRLRSHFYWPKMQTDIQSFIRTCPICQATKYQPLAPAGLLQPLPIPEDAWMDITMDFIVRLPSVHNKSTIMVVVDRLTKYAHFVPLAANFTAPYVAWAFISEICRLHGVPRSIVSDRDKIFMSNFWRTLFKAMGTTLLFSTAHHPETDGQTEVTNRTLE